MDSPIAAAKSALNVGFIVKLIVGVIVINALLELTGLSGWIYAPVTTAKAKFGGG